jgi:hypothetical protein
MMLFSRVLEKTILKFNSELNVKIEKACPFHLLGTAENK